MDLLQLKYFQMVAQMEHMTKAADRLAIAQPSLSKTIARLEEELGAPLFDRQGRHIRLNQFGKAFLRRVETIFNELEQGRREVADMAGLERGVVTLAASSLNLLPELLSSFLTKQPNVSFRLSQASTLKMQHLLESGEIDLCISSVPIDRPGIQWVPLITEEIFLAVPPGHRLAGRSSIRLSEVADDPFISLREGYGLRDTTDHFCRQAGFTPNIAYEVDEPAAIGRFVQVGIGVAFMPALAWIVGSEPVVQLHIEEPVCQRTMGLAWLKKRYLSTAADRFRQSAIEYFANLSG